MRVYIATHTDTSHPTLDIVNLRQGIKLARRAGQTAPLSNYAVQEVFPGPTVQTDADWDAWLAGQVGTECVASVRFPEDKAC